MARVLATITALALISHGVGNAPSPPHIQSGPVNPLLLGLRGGRDEPGGPAPGDVVVRRQRLDLRTNLWLAVPQHEWPLPAGASLVETVPEAVEDVLDGPASQVVCATIDPQPPLLLETSKPILSRSLAGLFMRCWLQRRAVLKVVVVGLSPWF